MADTIMADEFGNSRGETLVPGVEGVDCVELHKARYEWALETISGGRVLDVGCGVGYGSKILLELCSGYVGFDYHPSRKLRADADYADNRATFLTHSACDPFPFEDESFDNAVCFEAIEHVDKDYDALAEIHRVLKPGGHFVCSTPINKGQPKGHYHIREYTVEQFQILIGSQFSEVKYFGQPYSAHFLKEAFKHIYICCIATKAIS